MATGIVVPGTQWRLERIGSVRRIAKLAAAALGVLIVGYVVFASRETVRSWLPTTGPDAVRWLVSLLPGAIILNHVVYLMSSRRKQFREALGHVDKQDIARLEDLYFGYGPMLVRYVVPAVFVSVLCSAAITAITSPSGSLLWLWAPEVDKIAGFPAGWGRDVLRGAALGFVGGYVYLLLLLTDRARQRDVTTGVAVWAATMPVLGPLMGGIASLLMVSGAGSTPEGGSFTRDAVFFVAGMLPRQFATFVQAGVRKMFQTGSAVAIRTVPLTQLRGVGPDVEARLEEEGIHDVSALAYASPHQLMRATTYSPRQIVDWIDEALLIATVPAHWELLEKAGVTGAMDLGWYETRRDSIKALADEIKMPERLLGDVVSRLWQDAQVCDLYQLYWDHAACSPNPHAVVLPDSNQTQAPPTEG